MFYKYFEMCQLQTNSMASSNLLFCLFDFNPNRFIRGYMTTVKWLVAQLARKYLDDPLRAILCGVSLWNSNCGNKRHNKNDNKNHCSKLYLRKLAEWLHPSEQRGNHAKKGAGNDSDKIYNSNDCRGVTRWSKLTRNNKWDWIRRNCKPN